MPKGHAVVDGSNIATEGRSEPSLAQLEEAVAAFRDEYDFEYVTVIVDASFEHRVNRSETKRAREEVESGRIITPPAGVVGRGDTFILQVAQRANAVVLSNDSFQEFHGTYEWLFDEGRLIGGKPVPGVGWIYVPRVPVRGPVSRRATKAGATVKKPPAKKATKAAAKASTAKKTPAIKTPAIKTPAKKTPAKKAPAKRASTPRASKPAREQPDPPSRRPRDAAEDSGTNPRRQWDAFRRAHPEGSRITATVERFSSHGAYAHRDGVEIYIPLRLLGDPPPRRARDAVAIGETREFIVHRFDSERRGIDVGTNEFTGEPSEPAEQRPPAKRSARRATKRAGTNTSAAKKAAARKSAPRKSSAARPTKKTAKHASVKKATTRKPIAKKATAPRKKATTRGASSKKSNEKPPTKKTAAKKAARKAATKKTAESQTPTKKAGRTSSRRRR